LSGIILANPSYVLILDAHPIEDGRIQKHIRFLQEYEYTVYHIHFIPYIADSNAEDGEYSLFGEKSWHVNLHWKIQRKVLRLINYLSLFSPLLTRKTIDVIRILDIPLDKCGIIHVHDPILLPLAKKIQIEWLTQAKIVYDRHEVYEDMKRFAGIGGYRLFERIARNSVSGVVVVSDRHKDAVSGLFPGALVSTVPNFPMTAFINGKNVINKVDSFSRTNPIICIYIGSLRRDLDRDIDLLLTLADAILMEIPSACFFIGGPCDDEIVMEKMDKIQKKFQNRFSYIGEVPYDQLIRKTENAHIGFYLVKPDSSYLVPCSPNKIYEYLSCGVIPVIRADCDYKDKLQTCGLVYNQDASHKFIVDQLIALMKDPTQMSLFMRQSMAIGSQLTYESEALNYCKLYENLLISIKKSGKKEQYTPSTATSNKNDFE